MRLLWAYPLSTIIANWKFTVNPKQINDCPRKTDSGGAPRH